MAIQPPLFFDLHVVGTADDPDFPLVLRHAHDEVAEVEMSSANRSTGNVAGTIQCEFKHGAIIREILSFLIGYVDVVVEMDEIAGQINGAPSAGGSHRQLQEPVTRRFVRYDNWSFATLLAYYCIRTRSRCARFLRVGDNLVFQFENT